MFSVAPNGVVFKNKPVGVYAQMEKDVFKKRKETKKLMKKEKQGTDKYNELYAKQWAYKIILNGAFGTTAAGYSRYYSPFISDAITAVGRQSLKHGIKYANDILNSENIDLVNILKEIENE